MSATDQALDDGDNDDAVPTLDFYKELDTSCQIVCAKLA